MSKQDRTHSRTPADTESKFLLNLGKTFAEILGIATDARTTAENVKSELSKSVARIDTELIDKGAKIELVVDSGIVDENGNVQASIIINAINNESSAQIKAKNILFEGEKLNIKVDDTHIDGKLTAEKLNIDNIKAENVEISGEITAEKGAIGGWTLGETNIPLGVVDGKLQTLTVNVLRSESESLELGGYTYNYRVWLTTWGVYVEYYYDVEGGGASPVTIVKKSWLEICKVDNYFKDETSSEMWTFTLDDGTTVSKEVCIK